MRLRDVIALTVGAAGLLALTACGAEEQCRPGTIFLTATFAGAASTADITSLNITIDGKTITEFRHHAAGAVRETFEIEYSRYTPGQVFVIKATATLAGAVVGDGKVVGNLESVCTPAPLHINGVVAPDLRLGDGTVIISDGALPDLRLPDLQVPDMQVPDMRVPDLRAPDLRVPDLRVLVPDLATPPADLTAPRDFKPAPDLAPPIGHLLHIGGTASASSGTSLNVPVFGSGTVIGAGHTVLVALVLFQTSATTASATDSAGNLYFVDSTVAVGTTRVVILSAIGVSPLGNGHNITVTYATAGRAIVSADAFTGISGRDYFRWTDATSPSTFHSGNITTTQPTEALYGVVVITGNTTLPTWSSPWTPLPQVTVGSDQQVTAHRVVSVSGGYASTGTINGSFQSWMAGVASYY